MKITLEWPSPVLSPNFRGHWAKKATAAKKARKHAYKAALMSMDNNDWLSNNDGVIVFCMSFYPPDKRYRDDDNLIAMMKSYRDGIANALQINDKRFRTVVEIMPPEKSKERVEITLSMLKIDDFNKGL